MQDNTIADSPMVELLTALQHMLEQARVHSVGVGGSHQLQQLVIIIADGRFHEKESLQRVVAVSIAVHAVQLLCFVLMAITMTDGKACKKKDPLMVIFVGS